MKIIINTHNCSREELEELKEYLNGNSWDWKEETRVNDTKICALEGCNKPARKRFCSNKHKDKYHNRHNPRGKYAHLHPDNMDEDYRRFEDDHPLSSEALGQD